jgi:hypothetical protein
MIKRIVVVAILVLAAILLLLPFWGPPLFGDTDQPGGIWPGSGTPVTPPSRPTV